LTQRSSKTERTNSGSRDVAERWLSLRREAEQLASAAGANQHRDQVAVAETLQQLSVALTMSLELEDVLRYVLDELARLVPYDSATVMLQEDGVLRLHAQRGFDWDEDDDTLNRIAFMPGETPGTDEVFVSDQPIIFSDVREVPGWIWLPGSAHIRGWMGVPLRVQGRVIGMFSIDKAEPGFFNERHVALAGALAPHAAIAIERARLIQELRAAQVQLRGLSARVIEAQELERQRIGRELHDQAGQALLALRAELQILSTHIPKDASKAHEQIAKIDDIVRTTARDLRLLSHELHSHVLDEFGLASALQQQLRDFAIRFGITANFDATGNVARRWSPIIELSALRITQEALTNVARHSNADLLTVQLAAMPDRLVLEIEDNGQGFDYDSSRQDGCFGLIGMRERAMAANGSLQIRSRPNHGTQIVCEFEAQGK